MHGTCTTVPMAISFYNLSRSLSQNLSVPNSKRWIMNWWNWRQRQRKNVETNFWDKFWENFALSRELKWQSFFDGMNLFFWRMEKTHSFDGIKLRENMCLELCLDVCLEFFTMVAKICETLWIISRHIVQVFHKISDFCDHCEEF